MIQDAFSVRDPKLEHFGFGADIIDLHGPAKQIALGAPNQDRGACINEIPPGGGGGGGG